MSTPTNPSLTVSTEKLLAKLSARLGELEAENLALHLALEQANSAIALMDAELRRRDAQVEPDPTVIGE